MTGDVIVGRSRSYFNMKRFEDDIYNRSMIRQRKIISRKKNKIIDMILLFITSILAIMLLVTIFEIIFQNVIIFQKNREITTLEVSLDKQELKNDEYMSEIKDTIKYDNLKMKAYLEFNMITPTDRNIIYFDKSGKNTP